MSCDSRAPGGWRERNDSISRAKAIVRGIMAEPGVMTHVAVVPDDDEAILGYACIEPGEPVTCHYVYLRAKFGVVGFDGLPILRALTASLKGLRVEYTHRPAKGVTVPKGWTYAG